MVVLVPEQTPCKKCGATKDLRHTDKRHSDGWYWRCRPCTYKNNYEWNRLNPEYKPNHSLATRKRRKDAGMCTKCGKDVVISEALCFDCLGRMDEYNLTRRLM